MLATWCMCAPAIVSPWPEPPGWYQHPPLPAHTDTMATGGTAGWQITLIAAAAVLLAVIVAGLVYRARAAKKTTAPGT